MKLYKLDKPLLRTDFFYTSVRNNSLSIIDNFTRIFHRFLSLPNCSIRYEVLGERVNRGGGVGLEIPIEYRLQGHIKAIEWSTKKIEDALKMTDKLYTKWL